MNAIEHLIRIAEDRGDEKLGGIAWGRMATAARAELAALKAREERMRKALRQIRDHEHREMWSQGGAYRPASTPAETYKEGVQDGHRCAALIARAALAQDAGGEGTP